MTREEALKYAEISYQIYLDGEAAELRILDEMIEETRRKNKANEVAKHDCVEQQLSYINKGNGLKRNIVPTWAVTKKTVTRKGKVK